MPAVFPTLGSLGYEAKHGYRENLRVYENGGYRRYLKSSFNHKELNLSFKGVSQASKDAIVSFFNARKSSVSDSEFFVYNPEETTIVDLSGASGTGRHNAIFLDSELSMTRDGRCRWSGSTRVLLLN